MLKITKSQLKKIVKEAVEWKVERDFNEGENRKFLMQRVKEFAEDVAHVVDETLHREAGPNSGPTPKFKITLFNHFTSAGFRLSIPQVGEFVYIDRMGIAGMEDSSPPEIRFSRIGDEFNPFVSVKGRTTQFGPIQFKAEDRAYRRANDRVLDSLDEIITDALSAI
jgi:hypothetical protein